MYLYPTRFWRFFFSIRKCIAPDKNFLFNLSPVVQKGSSIALSILITLTTVSTWVHVIIWNDDSPKHPTYFEIFYTITVTSTSGLQTNLLNDDNISRAVNLCVMIVGAIYLPPNLSEFLGLLQNKSKYNVSYKPLQKIKFLSDGPLDRNRSGHHWTEKHVLVVGNILDVASLRGFLQEFFCHVYSSHHFHQPIFCLFRITECPR